MSWIAIDNNGTKMYQRNDGVTAHAYQIKHIEEAESRSLRQSMERTIYNDRCDYDDYEEYEAPSFAQVCSVLIVLIIMAIWV